MDKRWMAGWAAAAAMSCWCVARGTKVSTPRGPRRVEELAVGDELIAVNPDTGERAPTVLVAVRAAQRECGALRVAGSTLTVTSDHPLFDPGTGRFHPAGDWLTGARTQLLTFDGARLREVAVDGRQAFVSVEQVFDLSVAHAWHTFVAEGVVVHNKSPLGLGGLDCTLSENGQRIRADSRSDIPCRCAGGEVGVWQCDGYTSETTCVACAPSTPDAGKPDGGAPTDAGESADAGAPADGGP
jgi:hypothetical protein